MSAAPTAPPAATPRRRRWWIAGLALAALSAPWWLPNLPWSRQWIARQVSQRAGGLPCEIGAIWPLGWDGRVHVREVVFYPSAKQEEAAKKSTPPLARFPALHAEVAWGDSARQRRLLVRSLEINGGEITWRPTPGTPSQTAQPAIAPLSPSAPVVASARGTGLIPLADPEESSTPAQEALAEHTAVSAPETPGAAEVADIALSSEPTPEANPAAATDEPPVTTPPSAGETSAPATAAPAAPETPARPVVHRRLGLERFVLSDLAITLLPPGGGTTPLARARLHADIPLKIRTASSDGKIRVEAITVAGRAWPESIAIPLTWDGLHLGAANADVPTPGGPVRASFSCAPHLTGIPGTGVITIADLDLQKLASWWQPGLPTAQGTLSGQASLAAYAQYPRTLETRGQFQSEKITLPVHGWLRQAGLEAWAAHWPHDTLDARAASVQFRSAGPLFALDDASLYADDVTVRALGLVSAHGGPNLSARLYVPPGGADLLSQISQNWPPERRLAPAVLDNSPWAYLDTAAQGTWSRPTITLWGRAWTLPELRAEIHALSHQAPPTG